MRRIVVGVLSAVLLLGGGSAALVAPPAHGAKTKAKSKAKTKARHPSLKSGVYRTQGYQGRRSLPRTGPEPTPRATVLSSNGWKPDVHVDAAGTAHIVWVDDVDAAGQPLANDLLHYCRLPRGASACDNPTQTPFDPARTPSEDFAGPRILQIGDGLVVLTFRYPVVVDHPDGATSDRTLYAYTSVDGGTTWSAPVIVGTQEPSGGALVFGGVNPKIAVISDTQTGGTRVQTIVPGQYTRATALLGPGNEAYSGSLALDGEQPVAAFRDLSGYAVVRRLTPGGDPQNPDAWTRQTVPGLDEVTLASGPAGTFLFGRAPTGGPWTVRRVADGVPHGPVALPVPPNGTGSVRAFAQDASGVLHGVIRDGIGSTLFGTESADGGRSWSPTSLVARAATAGGGIDDVSTAVAKDGGGVTVYRRDPTGLTSGTIAATAFGTLSPTGVKGAGALAGTGVPGAFAGCDRVSFGKVFATPRQGCLLPSVDPKYPGAAVSQGPVDLNGLVLVPDTNVRILLDPRRRTIDTTGKVRVLLRGAGLEMTLLHAELHIKLDDVGVGGTLLDIAPSGLDLAGFPIAGRIKVQLTGTGARIPLSLSLPGAFGGITGDATLLLESGRGVQLESMRLAVSRAPLGPMEVRDLLISYTGGTETWSGKATLGLPPQPGGAALGADVTFTKGRFVMGNFELTPPYPGIAIGPNVYFTKLRGGFGLDPISFKVGASFGAFPIAPPDTYTVGVDGDLVLTVSGGTVLLKYTGVGNIANVSMNRVVLNAGTDGYADLTAGYDVDLVLVGLSGSLQGFVDGPGRQFGATADVKVRVAGLPAVGQRAAISGKGIGACYTVLGASFYAGYKFGQPIPAGVRAGATLGDCNLSTFEVQRPRARAAQAGGTTFTVAAGTRVQNVELGAAAGTPTVTLRAPDGTAVTPVDARATGSATGPAVALTMPEGARTLLILRDPKPGTWTVVPSPGSPAITGVLTARDAPAVKVRATVKRKGTRRVLRYAISGGGGAAVRFAERGGRGASADLGAAKGRAGTITFTPASGPAGRRDIVAVVSRGDVPASATVVTRYTAPAARRPATVRRVRARRSSRSVLVRWRGVPGARRYLVTVRGRTSKRVLSRLVSAKKRSVRVGGISVDDGRLTVTVAAQDRQGRSGRSGRARA